MKRAIVSVKNVFKSNPKSPKMAKFVDEISDGNKAEKSINVNGNNK